MLIKLLKGAFRGAADTPPDGEPQSSPNGATPGQREFVLSLLNEFYFLAHQHVADNYDYSRFRQEAPERANTVIAGQHAWYLNFFFEHAAAYFAAYELLDDAESRALFRRLILYRLLGHLHVVIHADDNWPRRAALLDRAMAYDRGESALDVGGLHGRIRHHVGVPTAGEPVALDCWGSNVVFTVFKRQYYFQRGGVAIAPRAGDVVIDAGACFGDTAVCFAQAVGPGGHVHAFDPLPAHQAVIDLNVRQNGLRDRITGVPLAVGDTTSGTTPAVVPPLSGSQVAEPGFSMLSAEGSALPVTTIDNYVDDCGVRSVDFIKMDIEGFELPALIGAAETIQRFRPRLAISLYHRPQDFFEIPLWLHERFPWYRLHLDHYSIHHEETVLFAVAG